MVQSKITGLVFAVQSIGPLSQGGSMAKILHQGLSNSVKRFRTPLPPSPTIHSNTFPWSTWEIPISGFYILIFEFFFSNLCNIKWCKEWVPLTNWAQSGLIHAYSYRMHKWGPAAALDWAAFRQKLQVGWLLYTERSYLQIIVASLINKAWPSSPKSSGKLWLASLNWTYGQISTVSM